MSAFARLNSRQLLALCFLLVSAAAGCSDGKPSPEQELDAAFADGKAPRLKVAKFEGQVTVDNQLPGDNYPFLYITLMDAEKFKDPAVRRWQTRVNKEGHFSFMTYLKHDGVPVGKYVAVFVDPSGPSKGQPGNTLGTGLGALGGTRASADKLKNLYNDPEVNLKNPELVVEVKEPGTTNQTFNLTVAGKEENSAPGPFAVKRITALPDFLQK